MIEKLRGLIIENHSEISQTLHEFRTRMLSNGTLESVETNLSSLHASPQDLITPILLHNCIIVQSEFLYKDQLEGFVNLFANQLPAMYPTLHPYRFYIWNLLEYAVQWSQNINTDGFKDLKGFLDNLTKIVDHYEVYSITDRNMYSMFTVPGADRFTGYSIGTWI